MKEPDTRPAPRLKFSKEEIPEEVTEAKPRRKVRWQLDSPVEATQNAVSQSSMSQAADRSSPQANDAQVLGSDITSEPDTLTEYHNLF